MFNYHADLVYVKKSDNYWFYFFHARKIILQLCGLNTEVDYKPKKPKNKNKTKKQTDILSQM